METADLSLELVLVIIPESYGKDCLKIYIKELGVAPGSNERPKLRPPVQAKVYVVTPGDVDANTQI